MARPALPPALERAVALHREAGSAGAAEARALLGGYLADLGYDVETFRFLFAPAALNAFPLAGAGLGWLTILEIPLLLMPAVPPWAALLVWAVGLAGIVALAAGTGLGWGPRSEGREDATLIARRGPGRVRRWIVAHVDTKAQGHSMAGRLVAVWLCILAAAALSILAVARLGGVPAPGAVAGAAGASLAAGVLASRGRLRGTTQGALDNGSGLVAALTAAALTKDPATGFLLTGAEEFGLVGARVLAARRRELIEGTTVINVDTLDERGALSIVTHDARGRELAEGLVSRIGMAGVPTRIRRLPLGIFVDSYPLARAGAAAVTIGRLDWGTLRRLHTPADALEGVEFATALGIGRALGALEPAG
ncbi:MAG TPA: M28 family peptidase [Gemmatimonadales bacterium]